MNLAHILSVNSNPDSSYVLEFCDLTPAERAEWEARRKAENTELEARRKAQEPAARAAQDRMDAELARRTHESIMRQGYSEQHPYPKSE